MKMLFLTEAHIQLKPQVVFERKAVDKKEMYRLMERDSLMVDNYVQKIKEKRKEIIKSEKSHADKEAKERAKRYKLEQKLYEQMKKAEEIIETQEEVARKKASEKIQKKMEKDPDMSPFYQDYVNLQYVPKPKEVFQLQAKSNSIKQTLGLKKSKIELLKEKQLKEMDEMISFEMNLQRIKSTNQLKVQDKFQTLKDSEKYKESRHNYHMEYLKELKSKWKLQKKAEQEEKKENVKRVHQTVEFEKKIKLKRIEDLERRAFFMKKSEENYTQNRKYMMKNLHEDFTALKKGNLSVADIDRRYAFLKDNQAFNEEMNDLNRRRASKTDLSSEKHR